MGRIIVFLFILVFFSAPVWAEDAAWAPRIIPLPLETHDYLAVVTWDPPQKLFSQQFEDFEYRAEAALDPDFAEIASSSAWLKWDAWSFILSPLPKGEIFIRIGSRLSDREEIFWSETGVTNQKGPKHPFSPPPGPRPSFFPSPSPSPSSPPHPIIFVHGFHGQPSDWKNRAADRDYVGILEKEGFLPELIGLYSYADYNRDGVYDDQGDIQGIAQDLPGAVEKLSQAHRDLGGNGQVDIVAFSLGGLVSRAYFSSPQFSDRVRRFIDVASPHKGIFIGHPVNWLDSLPFKGAEIRKAFLRLAGRVWNKAAGENRPIDFNSPAAQQVIPGSQFLKELNQVQKTPKSLDYFCLYGDIHATFNQKIFHWTLRSKKFSLGDLLIAPESATGVPGDLCQGFGFIDEKDFEVKMVRGKVTPFLEVVAPLDSLRFWHGKMIKQKEIKNKVLELLEKEE